MNHYPPLPSRLSEALDDEFVDYLRAIEQHFQKLPTSLQARVQKWVHVLLQSDKNYTWKKNRNKQIKNMHRMVLKGQLSNPFDRDPHYGEPNLLIHQSSITFLPKEVSFQQVEPKIDLNDDLVTPGFCTERDHQTISESDDIIVMENSNVDSDLNVPREILSELRRGNKNTQNEIYKLQKPELLRKCRELLRRYAYLISEEPRYWELLDRIGAMINESTNVSPQSRAGQKILVPPSKEQPFGEHSISLEDLRDG